MDSHTGAPVYTVDAFTDQQFSGNPAAVCMLQKAIADKQMQKIAAEMNLSETAFITRLHTSDAFETASRFSLRWFSPICEVPLCGHATLASAAALFYCHGNPSTRLEFETASGCLVAERDGDAIVLDMPANPPQLVPWEKVADLVEVTLGAADVEEVQHSPGTRKLMVRLKDTYTRTEFEALSPPTEQMLQAEPSGFVKGVILTLKGTEDEGCTTEKGEKYDFLSRYFSPWNGIPEDPVTGSAHTVLAPYWSSVLRKSNMLARQCSARGGELYVRVAGGGRVHVAGKAVIVMKGLLLI